MFSPGDLHRHGWARGILLKPHVETDGRDDEDTESDDLSNEADNDDGFRGVQSALVGFCTIRCENNGSC
jgi:hypothetical protein